MIMMNFNFFALFVDTCTSQKFDFWFINIKIEKNKLLYILYKNIFEYETYIW